MGIEALPAVLVLYDDIVSIARVPADESYGAVGKSLDVRTAPDGEIGAVMEFDLVLQRVQSVAETRGGIARDGAGVLKGQARPLLTDIHRQLVVGKLGLCLKESGHGGWRLGRRGLRLRRRFRLGCL